MAKEVISNMPQEVVIAAVGDILISQKIIRSAQIPGRDAYNFDPVFRYAAPFLQQADLTIGNLEIPLAGREQRYTSKHPGTGFYTFNAPDELAPALRSAGFDLLVTANNHCIDRGIRGLQRTLDVLDAHGLAHTGTYRSRDEADKAWIQEVGGLRIGVLAYSKSTNRLPLPPEDSWCVDLIDEGVMCSRIRMLKPLVDVLVVCPHWGREYTHEPAAVQKRLVRMMLQEGVHLILGAHPHVVQPAYITPRGQAVVYSLGNFVSTTLMKRPATRHGMILQARIVREDDGRVRVKEMSYLPTWVRRSRGRGGLMHYEVIPVPDLTVAAGSIRGLSPAERREMRAGAVQTLRVLRTPVPRG